MRETGNDAPLAGVRVLVTRPLAQADALAGAVRQAGGEAITLPAVVIEGLPRDGILSALAAAGLAGRASALAVFISANAVEFGAWLVREGHLSPRRVAAIGEATAGALADAGIRVDVVPAAGYTSEALLAQPDLTDDPLHKPTGDTLYTPIGTTPEPGRVGEDVSEAVIVRGVGGRELLARELAARGMRVTTIDVYRRVVPDAPDAQQRAALQRGPIPLVTATSVEILHNLLSMLGTDADALRRDSRVIVPSERVAAAVVNAGFRLPPLRSAGASNDATLEAMLSWCRAACRSTGDAGDEAGSEHGPEHQ